MTTTTILLIWLVCSFIVMMKTYEANNEWTSWMIPLFVFSPVVLVFRIIDQLFFNKWRNIN